MEVESMFVIYMIPFKRGKKNCLYTGYTRLDRVAIRRDEHLTDKQYHWTGEMHVVCVEPGRWTARDDPKKHGNDFGLVVCAGPDVDLKQQIIEYALNSISEAMGAERFVKRQSRLVKKMAYNLGILPDQFNTK